MPCPDCGHEVDEFGCDCTDPTGGMMVVVQLFVAVVVLLLAILVACALL